MADLRIVLELCPDDAAAKSEVQQVQVVLCFP
jgi:hypothetical protein